MGGYSFFLFYVFPGLLPRKNRLQSGDDLPASEWPPREKTAAR